MRYSCNDVSLDFPFFQCYILCLKCERKEKTSMIAKVWQLVCIVALQTRSPKRKLSTLSSSPNTPWSKKLKKYFDKQQEQHIKVRLVFITIEARCKSKSTISTTYDHFQLRARRWITTTLARVGRTTEFTTFKYWSSIIFQISISQS
jgi:hypothetical protein